MPYLIVSLIAFVLAAPGFAHDESSQSALLQTVTIEPRLNAQLPLEFFFRDESGRDVRLQEFFNNKPVLLAFVYYDCPQLCPLVLDGLGRSLRVLTAPADTYRVIAVSIDPNETPTLAAATKQKHLARFAKPGAAADWHFLTGSAPAIAALAQAAGYRYAPDPSSSTKRFIHAAATLAVTPGGRISRYLYGFDYAPKDLRFALIEASGNRIGSAVERLLMLCYEYDPAKGKYTVAVMKLLRGFGVLTILALGGFITLMLRRERGRRALPVAGEAR